MTKDSKRIVSLLGLLFFYPAGLIFLWFTDAWGQKTKKILGVGFGFLFLIILIVSALSPEVRKKPVVKDEKNQATDSQGVDRHEEPGVQLVFDVASVIKKDRQAVANAIGKPTECGKSKAGERCFYPNDIEIVFISGKADWITLPSFGLPFSMESIKKLGLSGSPVTKNPNVITWKNIQGILEISMFPGQSGQIDYVYIKASTK